MAAPKKKQKAAGTLPPDVLHKYRTAMGLLQGGDLSKASAMLRDLLATRPTFSDARCSLGVALLEQGRLDEAEHELLEVVRVRPNHAASHRSLGNVYYFKGLREKALEHYSRALESKPDDAGTLNNKATVLQECHRLEEAVEVYLEAARLRPQDASIHNNLANTYRLLGRLDEAEEEYRQAATLNPRYFEALCNWGALLEERGDLEGARTRLDEAIGINPSYPDAHNNLGSVLLREERLEEARGHLEAALRLNPSYPEPHYNLGLVYSSQGDLPEAAEHYRQALALRPTYFQAQSRLADVLADLGDLEQALQLYVAAVQARPDDIRLVHNLGSLLAKHRHYEEATECYRQALAVDDRNASLHLSLANALRARNHVAEAMASYERATLLDEGSALAWADWGSALVGAGNLAEGLVRLRRALDLSPSDARIHANYIYALDLDPETDAASALAERRRFQERQATRLGQASAEAPRFPNAPDPERRIRVGYVSADFRAHSAAQVSLPLIQSHDRSRIEVFCYSDAREADAVTNRFCEAASAWRNIVGLSDARLVEKIREDRIDILVDLGGYAADNRLTAFMRRAAPIQATGWGYGTGTGLDAMDHLISDAVVLPLEEQALCAERIVHLPCIFAFEPPPRLDLAPLPAARNGYVTFGSFNRLAKIQADVIATWAGILQRLPTSRLLLKDRALDDSTVREGLAAAFMRHGVEPTRLVFRGGGPREGHLTAHHGVDIALDPFPQSGGVTTLESLWMGVPVVTLYGSRPGGRATASLLAQVDARDFVARSREEYVSLAVQHAGDLDRLGALREGLRARLSASPILDRLIYGRAVDEAFRTMWRAWCARISAG